MDKKALMPVAALYTIANNESNPSRFSRKNFTHNITVRVILISRASVPSVSHTHERMPAILDMESVCKIDVE